MTDDWHIAPTAPLYAMGVVIGELAVLALIASGLLIWLGIVEL